MTRASQPISAERQPAALSALAALGILASGLYGTGFWLTVDAGPSPTAIETAARSLRAEHQSGDLIFLVPHYATRAREHLGDLHPLAVRDPLLEDLRVSQRVWVFGLFDAAEALRPRFLAAGHQLLRSQSADGVTVDLYQTTADQKRTFDFVASLRQAKVFHEQGAKRTPCSQWLRQSGQGGPGGRWSCPTNSDWFYVAPEWHRMGDHLRLCLWAHPPPQGRLLIEFGGVPLTGHLFGRAGHTLNASKTAQAPVYLDVAIGEGAPHRFQFAEEETFRPFLVPTSTTGTATIAFGVSSPNNGANHFCFSAELRGPSP